MEEYNVKELVDYINKTRTQVSSSAKDEVRVMRAMLNDSSFVVDVYSDDGVIDHYSPYEDSRSLISDIIKNTTNISGREADHLASGYEFTNRDARSFINLSKHFITTYLETGRKLPLGGRERSDIALSKKTKSERVNSFPKKVGVNDDGTDKYEICGEGNIPEHDSIRVHSSCPKWLK